jgi:hypothetical protein
LVKDRSLFVIDSLQLREPRAGMAIKPVLRMPH